MSGLQGTVIARNGCCLPQGTLYERWVTQHANNFAPVRQSSLNRGESRRPRVPMRCTWPLAGCPGAPVCTAAHVDGDAETAVAA